MGCIRPDRGPTLQSPARHSAGGAAPMQFMVVIRWGRKLDEGAVVVIDGHAELWRFVRDWQTRHSRDRISIFSSNLEPFFVLDSEDGVQDDAHSGSRASGTLS